MILTQQRKIRILQSQKGKYHIEDKALLNKEVKKVYKI